MEKFKGYLHSFESFGSVDGPGVRCVVFMQGCNMRCRFCHNPDTWDFCGQEITADELFEKVWKYRSYWGKAHEKGGVTVSGGEPLLQIPFVLDFFKLLKQHGVHTAIDTAGQPFSSDANFLANFDELLKYTDLVLLDIKAFDRTLHKELTGHTNENILEMARYLSDKGIPMWIRHVLVPGVTDSADELTKIAQFVQTLKTVEKLEILPYHTLGKSKWERLNIPYSLEGVNPPTVDEIKKAKEYFK
ncbi:MAG: pyruvate formate lyase-activating protein [Clostridia bacterium]|nr:pyruvate formate lyase-activating protein [Clostridia bacterium]